MIQCSSLRGMIVRVRCGRDDLVRRTSEPALSAYYSAYTTHRIDEDNYIARHLSDSLAALVALARLPVLTAVLGGGVEAAAIRGALQQVSGLFGVRRFSAGQAVLHVPKDAADYLVGARKQTLRRKIRSARRAGVTWRPVVDVDERRALLVRADEAERNHPDEQYRIAEPDNADMLNYALWLVAYSAAGEPLLLSVTPIDGEWGWLRYFRTLGTGTAHSDSRYLMCEVLVEHLAAQGVRYLFDATNPIGLPDGLRQFQRMVGFRLAHISTAAAGERTRAGLEAAGLVLDRFCRGPLTASGRASRPVVHARDGDRSAPPTD